MQLISFALFDSDFVSKLTAVLLAVVLSARLLNRVFARGLEPTEAALFILIAERRPLRGVGLFGGNRGIGRPRLGTVRRGNRRRAVSFLMCHGKNLLFGMRFVAAPLF
jgi:hypothetical protein